MASFDIVCEINRSELINAVDQSNREVSARFDFKNTDAKYAVKDNVITMVASVDFQLKQMLDILHHKLTKRNIDLLFLKENAPVVQSKKAEQTIQLQDGISQPVAKNIIKFIKDQKLKVQAAVHGDQIRVTAKKIDVLQSLIALIKAEDFGLPLQFVNYR